MTVFTVTQGVLVFNSVRRRYAGHKKSAPDNTHRSGKYSAYRLLAEVFLFDKSYTVVDKHL